MLEEDVRDGGDESNIEGHFDDGENVDHCDTKERDCATRAQEWKFEDDEIEKQMNSGEGNDELIKNRSLH